MDGSGEAAEAPSPADLNHLRIIDRFPVLGCIRIQRVFAQKSAKRGRHLLVKWEGLSYDEATWELERDVLLFAQPGTVEAFEERAAKGVATAETVAFGVVAAATKNKPLDTQPPWMVGGNLHGYQLDGINWLRAKASARTHVILADEMGLGKTVQSAGLIAANSAEAFAPKSDKAAWKPALVIAPLSTLANWERELSNWCPWLHVVVLSGTAAARDLTKLHELSTESAANKTKGRRWVAHVVTSYEMATAERAFLARRTWSSMIVDEGHRLKSGTRGILFRDLSRIPAAHKVLLTGTPLQNAIEELHHLLHFLDEPGQGSRAKKPVDDSAFDAQTDDGESDGEEDALKLVELRHLLEGRMLRRLKADVLAKSALPPKKELVVRVELSKLQKHVYRSLLTKNYASLVDNTAQKKISKPKSLQNVVMQLRKACNHAVLLDEIAPEELSDDEGEAEDRRKKRLQRLLDGSGKLALLDRMLDKLKDRGHRVLIFSQMTRMLDVLEDYLSLKDFGFARFDGSTAARSRQALIDEFNSKGSNTFVFLLSTRAGGLGINLATADTVVIFDQDWNPHNDLQALARAHRAKPRIGQQQTVLVYRLVCRASVEERILHVAKKKLCLEALTIQSQAHKPLSRSELDDVLRYGAEELFAEAEDVITYDDAAVDALLDRSGPDEEDEEAPEVQKGALGKLMESFKTADSQFATPAAPAEAVAGAPPQKGAAMAAGAATAAAAMAAEKAADSPAARFDWAALLQDSYKSDQVMDFDKHGARATRTADAGAEASRSRRGRSCGPGVLPERAGAPPPYAARRFREARSEAARGAGCS
ncbi:P-loop containing nucleoside triphosphate hydrolase protein [Pelagophyceae sp. CCMP2097]|nr:P-loop containing nucleoside triphosphate hydrolase protein [Pelagophyceae sp. CCMP2097]